MAACRSWVRDRDEAFPPSIGQLRTLAKPSPGIMGSNLALPEGARLGGRASDDTIVQRYMKSLPPVVRNGVEYTHPWSPGLERAALYAAGRLHDPYPGDEEVIL